MKNCGIYYGSKNLHLGLCCINTILRQSKPTIFTSRSCTRKTFSVAKVTELSLQNVRDLVPMIEWNQQHGIRCFRLSSCMFPHFTDPETESFTIDFAIPDLQKAGALAKIPEYFLEIPQKYNVSFDLEVEAKAKEQAIFRLYSKYPFLCP